MFTVSKGDEAFFCSNEDYYTRHNRAWFFPATEKKHGTVLFGYSFYHCLTPLAGINDQGLSADENYVPQTPVKKDSNKLNYEKNFLTVLLEECSTVEEVIEWIKLSEKSYNLLTLEMYPRQIHVADKTGDAIVLGVGSDGKVKITRKTGDYLLSTNFNLALGRESCWRYEIAEKMLKQPHILSVNYCRSILKATHQGFENQWYTKYSYINDLKNRIIYIYSPHNYENFAIINLDEELSKGIHSYDILTLISQRGNLPPNLPLIASSFLILACILVGCALIWIRKIMPKLVNQNSIKRYN
ncbi:MAG: carcinine hydrolase/isopenicillin-N N-acyltransferase family protein [Promethearchaeota archaeon]